MTPKEFRECVRNRGAQRLSAASLERAVNVALKSGRDLREGDINSCIKLAQEFENCRQDRLREAGLASYLQPEPKTLQTREPPVTGVFMASDVVIEQLTPHIEQIRQELFGSHAPPFPTYEAAVEWLVREGNEQWRRDQARNEQKQREFRQKSGKGGIVLFWEPSELAIRQAQEQAGAVYHFSYERRRIPYTTSREDLIPEGSQHNFHYFRERYPDLYPGVEGWLWSVEIYEDSVLAKLEQKAYELADTLGLDQANVIAWILADEKPTIPAFRMHNEYKELKLPGKLTLKNRYVVIEVLEPEHLTYHQIVQIYDSIRQDFNVTRVKALTVSHQRLRDLVKRLGGVPKKHGTINVFWEQVRQAWNREVGREQYSNWRPLERQYQRLIKKLRLRDQQDRNGR
jgi:hypothetical protein